MSSEEIERGGDFDLPLPPPDQISVDDPVTLSQLMRFEYPAVHGDAYDVQAFVRQRWEPRKALMKSVYLRFTQAQDVDLIQPKHLTIPAGVLHWLASFEQWLKLSFLRDTSKTLEEVRLLAQEKGLHSLEALINNLGRIHDDVFQTMRSFLITVHYTHDLEEDPTELPLTNYEVYVAPTDSIISVCNDRECEAFKRNGDRNLLWWDHRRIILREGTDKQQNAQWLLQEKKEMEELAARYPIPGMLSTRPFMMPAIEFR